MSLPSLVEDLRASVAKHADRTAVTDGSLTLTYAELDHVADRVASALRRHGVRTGECVVWHGPKSSVAVAAIHGILRSGAGYVPLDPHAPFSRLELIARRAEPRALVVSAEFRDQWRESDLSLDWHQLPAEQGPEGGIWIAVCGEPARAPVDDLSYVLHTSGSTGMPKGVVHTHASASAFVDWCVSELEMTEHDVVINSAPLHFDPTVLHLFAVARVGAAVALMPEGDAPFPTTYIEFCERVGGTIWYAVTSTLVWLARHGTELLGGLGKLRAAVVGGEALLAGDVNTLFSAVPHIRLLNVYGPTESNVCTFHEIDGPQPEDAVIPIGRVLPGAEVIVVDDDLSPVAAGTSGQLLVRGSMMMTGYLDAEQTERSMVRSQDGRTWYATGDYVCENSRGELEFLGRRDTQIKSRGFRVELGEVERHARAFDGVHNCVAVASSDAVFSTAITLFVTAEVPAALTSLRGHLNDRLPHYMVPQRILHLNGELPTLSNGKVDRKQLTEFAGRPAAELESRTTLID
ncbi:amino acid adenylation domain-containing protein [Kitasatospora sp. NPDC096128]|uniref:amino acid adenylation domain-containing protein n=1 Tax=Kitasatospora sp. NPDC096128 TaxID=3155547 RepID=UPI00331ABA7B